jgi:hypothetical protein
MHVGTLAYRKGAELHLSHLLSMWLLYWREVTSILAKCLHKLVESIR